MLPLAYPVSSLDNDGARGDIWTVTGRDWQAKKVISSGPAAKKWSQVTKQRVAYDRGARLQG